MRAIGVISGTSMDGIDVASIETDGEASVVPGPGRSYPYPSVLKSALVELIATPERAEREPLEEIETAVSEAHAAAVERFLAETATPRGSVDLIGLHGQTVFHRPERRFTRQLGIGSRIAAQLGIPVVNRFRHADVASGGHGAPFVPLYHRALATPLAKPLMVLNLGGVANVTFIGSDSLIAFDTGPASALLDDFMRRHRGLAFDEGGAFAASGTVHRPTLDQLMRHPFFDRQPPKSLDRQDFHAWAAIVEALPDRDAAATLAAFTVRSVAAALRHVPETPTRWLVAGGGRLNAAFLDGLRDCLGVPVDPVEAVGWAGDFIEAQCFGYLAVRSRLGLPLSLPSTTGVPYPMTGGDFWTAA